MYEHSLDYAEPGESFLRAIEKEKLRHRALRRTARILTYVVVGVTAYLAVLIAVFHVASFIKA